ncbi:MAG: hypothetical protein JSS30_02975 [Verrucomicrobia bacterium]|nr:hypothetical protein [Verrucomicrobiota bacterium]
MKILRVGALLVGIFLVALGTYALLYRQVTFTEQEQYVNLTEIHPLSGNFPTIFSALLIVAGVVLIVLQLVNLKKE